MENPIGQSLPAAPSDTVSTFILQKETMQRILDSTITYFGFLLRDDENPGFTDWESRECEVLPDNSCPRGLPPQLELSFVSVPPSPRPSQRPSPQPTLRPSPRPTLRPSPRPTRRPSPKPTFRPSSRPTDATGRPSAGTPNTSQATDRPMAQQTLSPSLHPRATAVPSTFSAIPTSLSQNPTATPFFSTSQPSVSLLPTAITATGAPTKTNVSLDTDSAAVADACGTFQQHLSLNSADSLTGAARLRFHRNWQIQIESLTPEYISGVNNVQTTAAVLQSTPRSEQPTTMLTMGQFPIDITYRLCFDVPIVEDLSELVLSFPSQFVAYMSSAENRLAFEQELIEVASGSLSPVTPVDNVDDADVDIKRGSDSSTTIIASVVVTTTAAFMILGLVLWKVRSKTRFSAADGHPDEHQTRSTLDRGNTAAATAILPVEDVHGSLTSHTPLVSAAVLETDSNHMSVFETHQLSYKDQGRTVAHERTSSLVEAQTHQLSYKDQGRTVSHERTSSLVEAQICDDDDAPTV